MIMSRVCVSVHLLLCLRARVGLRVNVSVSTCICVQYVIGMYRFARILHFTCAVTPHVN